MNLEDEIEKIWFIYYEARQSFEIYKYLNEKKPTYILWKQMRYMCIKNSFIELDKLFSNSPNQKYNLSKLFNKLKPSGVCRAQNFPEDIINKWEGIMKEFKDHSKIISTLRSSKFAHTDRNFIYAPDIDFQEIERMFDFVEEVIEKIHKVCLKKHPIMNLSIYSEKLKFIDQLEEFKELKRKEVFRKLGKKSNNT